MKIFKCDRCKKVVEKIHLVADSDVISCRFADNNFSTFARFDMELCDKCSDELFAPIKKAFMDYRKEANKIEKSMKKNKEGI